MPDAYLTNSIGGWEAKVVLWDFCSFAAVLLRVIIRVEGRVHVRCCLPCCYAGVFCPSFVMISSVGHERNRGASRGIGLRPDVALSSLALGNMRERVVCYLVEG